MITRYNNHRLIINISDRGGGGLEFEVVKAMLPKIRLYLDMTMCFSMCGFRRFDRLWCIHLYDQSVFWECLTTTVKAVFRELLIRRHCVIYSGIWSYISTTNSDRTVNSLSVTYWHCDKTSTACFIIKISLIFSKIIFIFCISLLLTF
jgi:hypothetical protein